jgi:peptide subunit release factor 1 (eRF1)
MTSARSAAAAANHVIDRLLGFDAHGEHVLTAYLEVNPGTDAGRHPETQLQSLLRPIRARLDPEAVQHLDAEEARVLRALPSLVNGARGVAVFAAEPAGLLLLQPLPVAVGPIAFWDIRPHLRPLLSLVDEFQRSLVAVVDHEHARFFRVFMDQIEEIADVWSRVPKHQEQGGMAQSNIARHRDEAVKWHLRRVSNVLSQLVSEEAVDRLVLGGTADVVAELERLLPRKLAARLVGTFPVSLPAPPIEVLTRARHVLSLAERTDETERVEEVLEAMGRQQAALGLRPVAAAVAAGQVLLLVADADLRPPGYSCAVCDLALPTLNGGLCPACSGRVVEREDFVEYLAERVLEQGGRFEEVRGDAAGQLASGGGIAALLRYPVAQLTNRP